MLIISLTFFIFTLVPIIRVLCGKQGDHSPLAPFPALCAEGSGILLTVHIVAHCCWVEISLFWMTWVGCQENPRMGSHSCFEFAALGSWMSQHSIGVLFLLFLH